MRAPESLTAASYVVWAQNWHSIHLRIYSFHYAIWENASSSTRRLAPSFPSKQILNSSEASISTKPVLRPFRWVSNLIQNNSGIHEMAKLNFWKVSIVLLLLLISSASASLPAYLYPNFTQSVAFNVNITGLDRPCWYPISVRLLEPCLNPILTLFF